MRRKVESSTLAVSLLTVMLLTGCSGGQNANQTKIVAGKFYRDVNINVVAEYG